MSHLSQMRFLSPSARAWTFLLTGVLCIGLSPIFVRWAGVPGAVSAFWRVAIAALGLALILLWKRPGLPPVALRLPIAAGGVLFACDLAFWNESLLRIPVAIATPLGNSAPLWVGLGGWLLWGHRPARNFWIGLAIAFAGILLVSQQGTASTAHCASGILMALVASLFYAGYLLLTSRVRTACPTLSMTGLSTFASAAALAGFNLATSQNLTDHSGPTWAALVGLGLVSHLAGWLLINHALGVLPPTTTSVALLGQTVVAGALAVPLLGERPGLATLAGSALVLVGIWSSRPR